MTLSIAAQKRQIDALLAKQEKVIADAFLMAMQQATFVIDQAALIAALDVAVQTGNLAPAQEVLRISRAALFPLTEGTRGTYLAGAQSVTPNLPRGLRGAFGFDGSHPNAVAFVAEKSALLVEAIQIEQVQSVRAVIQNGINTGQSSQDMARDITGRVVGRQRVGGIVGLNSQQTDSIIRGRARLLSGDPSEMQRYLDLKLRDRKHDRTIKAAIRDERQITAQQVDRIIGDHKNKALGYRGRVIAKQEAHTALMAGRNESYDQMLASGQVESITHRWQHNLSVNPRIDHVQMNGTIVQHGEPFVFPDGTRMMHPGDPAGGAEHTIGCRCVAVSRVRLPRD